MLRYSIDMKGVHLGKKEGFVQKVRKILSVCNHCRAGAVQYSTAPNRQVRRIALSPLCGFLGAPSNAYGKAILTRQRPVIGNRQFTEMFSDGFKI